MKNSSFRNKVQFLYSMYLVVSLVLNVFIVSPTFLHSLQCSLFMTSLKPFKLLLRRIMSSVEEKLYVCLLITLRGLNNAVSDNS